MFKEILTSKRGILLIFLTIVLLVMSAMYFWMFGVTDVDEYVLVKIALDSYGNANKTADQDLIEPEVKLGQKKDKIARSQLSQRVKLRKELMEILEKSSQVASDKYGFKVEPAWILGTLIRESSASLFSKLNQGIVDSLYNDLVYSGLAVERRESPYVANGYSHFEGGSVVDGVDLGNPRYMRIETSKELYDEYAEGDLAVGVMQFEIPYVYSHLRYRFGETKEYVSPSMDASLDMMRPNVFYIPDVMQSAAMILARPVTVVDSAYDEILRSSDFQSLSDYNQRYIKFVYASSAYGRGSLRVTDDVMVYALIQYGLRHPSMKLDEFLLGARDSFYDDSLLHHRTGIVAASDYMLGLDFATSFGVYRGDGDDYSKLRLWSEENEIMIYWYGMYAGNIGRLVWNELDKLIYEESGGPDEIAVDEIYLGRKGSGKFVGSGSIFYHSDLGLRFYHQYEYIPGVNSPSNVYAGGSENWGAEKISDDSATVPWRTNHRLGGGTYVATMGTSGCGFYSMAFIGSNLLNRDVTPKALRDYLGRPSAHCGEFLHYSGIPVLTQYMGLSVRVVRVSSPSLKDEVYSALDRGDLVLFTHKNLDSHSADNVWYNGGGHYMVLRGYEDTPERGLLCYTSFYRVGNSVLPRLSADEVMKLPMSFETWRAYLNSPDVWIIGRGGN